MDEGTTLADLLSLNLHEFEDEVRNIVDKAVKEMSMEKVCQHLHLFLKFINVVEGLLLLHFPVTNMRKNH